MYRFLLLPPLLPLLLLDARNVSKAGYNVNTHVNEERSTATYYTRFHLRWLSVKYIAGFDAILYHTDSTVEETHEMTVVI